MEVAYIFDDSKVLTGAHHINRLIVNKLREQDIKVVNYYPKALQHINEVRFKGLKNILFFYSLIEQKREILNADIIQGTTYTPLCFVDLDIPVVCHFGSTTWGLINAVPQTHRLEESCKNVYFQLKNDGIISELSIKSRRPMRDIAEVELYTSLLADKVIATSMIVSNELIKHGVPREKIAIIHNAIEDFWFDDKPTIIKVPNLVFLGRIEGDVFNLKLKGIDRVIAIYKAFPKLNKITIAATNDTKLSIWLDSNIKNHTSYTNLNKLDILKNLNGFGGSFILITSRYEGFSLSLIEAMSQGLIPIAYSVGVVPEIIVNNENGFIVKTVNGAIDIITSLQDNPEELKRLSLAASKTASNFRGDKMANQLRGLYEDVLETHNKTKLEMSKIEKEKKKLKRIADALVIVKKNESSD